MRHFIDKDGNRFNEGTLMEAPRNRRDFQAGKRAKQ